MHTALKLFYWGVFLWRLVLVSAMIISFTIINDFYYSSKHIQVVSYTVLTYAFIPAISIALGGFITTHLFWIDCFYFYRSYALTVA